ncbi:MAG: helix-turn-helix domain-containing protein [Rothia sp. (in: high G+C Gram-positive bacteria)]|uniref:TetR/AcrR family transcriptional regulator n=1 Tax=Rothia sp. (in: high G+C Gram-positive bacteria) TaxID=1885016 RepID=UPI0026DFBD60|nr:TetR/AcrR family transcriptional regulator [Rothia sp. (in: high G+C Gram-positive bacteria)]MDO5750518.1 helix-turn-helix domain-containing protein [Rothia sp. (in: high G+C Gram-positive bacteria)]
MSPKPLRERRRARTWQAIHAAASTLAATKGLRETTIEQIAEQAGVSTRTFFNYFATKEDAILGISTLELTDQMLEQDAQRGDNRLIVRLTHLLLTIVRAGFGGTDIEQIRQNINRYPELMNRVKVHNHHAENLLRDFLTRVDWERFTTAGYRGPFPLHPAEHAPEPNADQQQMIESMLHLASAILRQVRFGDQIDDVHLLDTQIRALADSYTTILTY